MPRCWRWYAVALRKSLTETAVDCFYLLGRLHEFNFAKFWTQARQEFQCDVLGDFVQWRISAQVSGHQIEIDLQCWREEMLLMNYRTPMDFTVTLNCGMAGQLVG